MVRNNNLQKEKNNEAIEFHSILDGATWVHAVFWTKIWVKGQLYPEVEMWKKLSVL